MTNINREIFAKNLKYYMELSGKTQADICRLFNISSATVSNWCNGKIMPRSDKIYTLSDWLGVEPSQLITEHPHSAQDILRDLAKEKIFLEHYSHLSPEYKKLTGELVTALDNKEQSPDELLAWMQKFLELIRPQ